jgi:hypothetical protein
VGGWERYEVHLHRKLEPALTMLLKLKELRSGPLRCDPFRKIAGNTAGRWLASGVPGIVFLVELIADGGRRQRGVAATPGELMHAATSARCIIRKFAKAQGRCKMTGRELTQVRRCNASARTMGG